MCCHWTFEDLFETCIPRLEELNILRAPHPATPKKIHFITNCYYDAIGQGLHSHAIAFRLQHPMKVAVYRWQQFATVQLFLEIVGSKIPVVDMRDGACGIPVIRSWLAQIVSLMLGEKSNRAA